MTLYRGTYRVESARHPDWDYGNPGWYFVTLCTQKRICFFGTIQNGMVGLSHAGCVAHRCWTAIPDHFDHVRLDAFVIMPNHVHGLVGIMDRLPEETRRGTEETRHGTEETRHGTSLRGVDDHESGKERRSPMSEITPDSGSLGIIINQYKGAVTRTVRRGECTDFAWQPRYHDRIVRDEREFQAIRRYIVDNPIQWTGDRLHSNTAPR